MQSRKTYVPMTITNKVITIIQYCAKIETMSLPPIIPISHYDTSNINATITRAKTKTAISE